MFCVDYAPSSGQWLVRHSRGGGSLVPSIQVQFIGAGLSGEGYFLLLFFLSPKEFPS